MRGDDLLTNLPGTTAALKHHVTVEDALVNQVHEIVAHLNSSWATTNHAHVGPVAMIIIGGSLASSSGRVRLWLRVHLLEDKSQSQQPP